MTTPLAIVSLGMLGGGGGAATYLQGGTEVAIALEPVTVEFTLDPLPAEFALRQIDAAITGEPVNFEVENDEIAVDA